MAVLDCIPVKLHTLPIGFELESEVYSRRFDVESGSDGEFTLLCKNEIITGELIDRLKRRIHPEITVYIDRRYIITNLFASGHYLGYSDEGIKAVRDGEELYKAKRFAEAVRKYEKTKDSTNEMLFEAAKTGKIDKSQGAAIAQDIQGQVDSIDVSTIIQMINQIRSADQYLHTHSLNVSYLNGLMGRWLKFDPTSRNELVQTGLFHDLGKIELSKELLRKTGGLNPEEFAKMRKHPILSLEALMKSGVRNKAVLEGVLQHHEREDGSGYPKGIGAEKICEYARITAISDTYDTMVTTRCDSDSLSPFVILNEFDKGGYIGLDIRYESVFVACMLEELKGKEIIMNDGREAAVLLVNARHLLYPIVEIDGKLLMTNDDFYCVRMKNSSKDKYNTNN